MNSILNEIQTIIQNAVKQYLPDVSLKDFEEDGKIYYMNGNNGTEFDWFVNEHLPTFMVFYNDKDNLGAAKAYVYVDGGISLYLFDNHGKDMIKEIKTFLDVNEIDLLRLAVCLRNNADEKSIWDSALDKIESDTVPDENAVTEFLNNKQYYEPSIRRKEIIGKLCVASKKITREGWKVGVMSRDEPIDNQDSGWQFFAGDEDDDYINNVDNVELCVVNSIIEIDPAAKSYIDSPVGTTFVRKSSDKFEEDKNQMAYMEKWRK